MPKSWHETCFCAHSFVDPGGAILSAPTAVRLRHRVEWRSRNLRTTQTSRARSDRQCVGRARGAIPLQPRRRDGIEHRQWRRRSKSAVWHGEGSLERRVRLPPLSGGGRAVPLRKSSWRLALRFANYLIFCLPIRLLPTPPTCRVLPGSGVKLCVGRCGDVARGHAHGRSPAWQSSVPTIAARIAVRPSREIYRQFKSRSPNLGSNKIVGHSFGTSKRFAGPKLPHFPLTS